MKYTPERIAKARQKEAQTPDNLKRDPNVNYYEGWFFVTLNTRDKAPVLSTCVGSPDSADGEPDAPRCKYTELGLGVLAAWKKMAEVCKTVEIDLCEAMPEHFHGLVHLLPGNRRHLGSLISGFMSGCSHAYWDTLGIDWRKNRDEKVKAKNEGGKTAYAALTPDRDRDHSHSYIGPALFVHGYNDTEPITEAEVEVKRAYIRDQARKRLIQGDHHDCFRKYRHKRSRNWTIAWIVNSLAGDPSLRHYAPARLKDAIGNILARLNTGTNLPSPQHMGNISMGNTASPPSSAGYIGSSSYPLPSSGNADTPEEPKPAIAYLDHIGSMNLLMAPRKLSLICHRADAWQFEVQKAAVLKAAREGAVIVSAFISPKEREIREQLMVELLPFIEIMDNGISEKYKGTGKSFYALAENRLFQISPWSYCYRKDSAISREMCLVMNELARIISGVADDWWKSSC